MIHHLDHLVLTVKNLEKSVAFYTSVMGMEKVEFGPGRIAVKFGNQKINFHAYGQEFEPKAQVPTPGSADLCFITDKPINDVAAHLKDHDISIEEGPIMRTGVKGPILSIYIRDPDKNLIEIANDANHSL